MGRFARNHSEPSTPTSLNAVMDADAQPPPEPQPDAIDSTQAQPQPEQQQEDELEDEQAQATAAGDREPLALPSLGAAAAAAAAAAPAASAAVDTAHDADNEAHPTQMQLDGDDGSSADDSDGVEPLVHAAPWPAASAALRADCHSHSVTPAATRRTGSVALPPHQTAAHPYGSSAAAAESASAHSPPATAAFRDQRPSPRMPALEWSVAQSPLSLPRGAAATADTAAATPTVAAAADTSPRSSASTLHAQLKQKQKQQHHRAGPAARPAASSPCGLSSPSSGSSFAGSPPPERSAAKACKGKAAAAAAVPFSFSFSSSSSSSSSCSSSAKSAAAKKKQLTSAVRAARSRRPWPPPRQTIAPVDDSDNEEYCNLCRETGREDEAEEGPLLRCDGICAHSFHFRCLSDRQRDSMTAEGDEWFCRYCSKGKWDPNCVDEFKEQSNWDEAREEPLSRMTLLMTAVGVHEKAGRMAFIRHLCTRNRVLSSIAAVDAEGRTLLHHCAQNHAPASLTLLFLRLGVDPNVPDAHGNAALHRAFSLQAVSTVLALLTAPNINVWMRAGGVGHGVFASCGTDGGRSHVGLGPGLSAQGPKGYLRFQLIFAYAVVVAAREEYVQRKTFLAFKRANPDHGSKNAPADSPRAPLPPTPADRAKLLLFLSMRLQSMTPRILQFFFCWLVRGNDEAIKFQSQLFVAPIAAELPPVSSGGSIKDEESAAAASVPGSPARASAKAGGAGASASKGGRSKIPTFPLASAVLHCVAEEQTSTIHSGTGFPPVELRVAEYEAELTQLLATFDTCAEFEGVASSPPETSSAAETTGPAAAAAAAASPASSKRKVVEKVQKGRKHARAAARAASPSPAATAAVPSRSKRQRTTGPSLADDPMALPSSAFAAAASSNVAHSAGAAAAPASRRSRASASKSASRSDPVLDSLDRHSSGSSASAAAVSASSPLFGAAPYPPHMRALLEPSQSLAHTSLPRVNSDAIGANGEGDVDVDGEGDEDAFDQLGAGAESFDDDDGGANGGLAAAAAAAAPAAPAGLRDEHKEPPVIDLTADFVSSAGAIRPVTSAADIERLLAQQEHDRAALAAAEEQLASQERAKLAATQEQRAKQGREQLAARHAQQRKTLMGLR